MTIKFNINEIRERVLFGIPLFDSDGNPFPDSLLQSYLDSAISWAEQTLNVAIQPREIEEWHDFLRSDYVNWGFLRLHKKPVIEIESLELYYGDRPMLTIPKNWIKLDHVSGFVQIFPTGGTSGGMIIDRSGALVLPIMNGLNHVPQMWKVKYKAGMTEPKNMQAPTRTDIHPNLIEVIYKKASIGIVGVYGELIIGAGIANQSIGIDGLSQSIGTTQSAMYSGASARIEQLQKDIDSMLPGLRSHYGGIDMVVL